MSKKGYSRQGLFGDIHHYDEHGHKTGTSRPGIFGGYTNYDAHGNKTGHSDPGFLEDISTMTHQTDRLAQVTQACSVITIIVPHRDVM